MGQKGLILAVKIKLVALFSHFKVISLILLRLDVGASISVECLSLFVILPTSDYTIF